MRPAFPAAFSALLLVICKFGSLEAQDPSWFTNVTAQVGLSTTPEALRINATDLNGDQYPDLVTVQTVNLRDIVNVWLNRQDTNSANPLDRIFVDFTDSSGVNVHQLYADSTRRAEIVSLADFDNDGDADLVSGTWFWDPLVLNNPLDRSAVMLNDGTGRFTHVPNNGFEALGQVSIGGFSFLDYNYDGFIDIYVATFSDDHPNNVFRQDYLMVGNGDGTFFKRSGIFDLDIVKFPMYGASVTDWDNDCYQDVFTSAYCRSDGNLWRNLNGGAFQDVANAANYSSQHMQGDTNQGTARDLCQWGAYPFDFDNDGDMDLFQALVHGGIDSTEGRSTIAVNSGAANNYTLYWELDRLRRNNPQSTHLGNMDAAWLDIDNNMQVDLIVTETEYMPGTDRGYFYLQDTAHFFDDRTLDLGLMNYRPHALEPIDYDLDGDYDLVMNDRNAGTQIRVLRNEVGLQNNWVGVRLLAPATANRDAIGARVTVYAGGVAQIREVQAGYGHWGGQNPSLLLFGLASTAGIDSIAVRWPVGTCATTVVAGLFPNQVYTIEETGVVLAEGEEQPGHCLVYPNPVGVGGMITVDCSLLASSGARLEFVSMWGQRVALVPERIGETRVRVGTTGLAAGVYVLRVWDGWGGGSQAIRLLVR